jgi:hypothetical protein
MLGVACLRFCPLYRPWVMVGPSDASFAPKAIQEAIFDVA